MSLLEIKDLNVSVGGKEIIKGLSLAVNAGEIHVVIGPNGSGKSTLCNAVIGHPDYKVTSGELVFDGQRLNGETVDKRAKAGLFLAFQNPAEIEGLTLQKLLKEMAGKDTSIFEFRKNVLPELKAVGLDENFLARSVNFGFSGGEKKKSEILQMGVLKPRLALIDEPDSGLDVDALRLIAKKIREAAEAGTGILLITHLPLLRHLSPDFVHVMSSGKIVESGGPELIDKVEREGFKGWGEGDAV